MNGSVRPLSSGQQPPPSPTRHHGPLLAGALLLVAAVVIVVVASPGAEQPAVTVPSLPPATTAPQPDPGLFDDVLPADEALPVPDWGPGMPLEVSTELGPLVWSWTALDGPSSVSNPVVIGNGFAFVSNSDSGLTLWISDGDEWMPRPLPADLFSGSGVTRIDSTGDGLVATGWSGEDGTPTVWFSPDLENWTRLEVPPAPPYRLEGIFVDSYIQGAQVVAGKDPLLWGQFHLYLDWEALLGTPVQWEGRNGEHTAALTRVRAGGPSTVTVTVRGEGSFLVVRAEDEDGASLFDKRYEMPWVDPALIAEDILDTGFAAGRMVTWQIGGDGSLTPGTGVRLGDGTAHVVEVIAGPDRYLAFIAHPSGKTGIWNSTDGTHWGSLPHRFDADPVFNSVTAESERYLLVGVVRETIASSSGLHVNSSVAAAFSSIDGMLWSRVDFPRLLSPSTLAAAGPLGWATVSLGCDVGCFVEVDVSGDGNRWERIPLFQSGRGPTVFPVGIAVGSDAIAVAFVTEDSSAFTYAGGVWMGRLVAE